MPANDRISARWLSPRRLALLAALPFLVSLIVHLAGLFYADQVRWNLSVTAVLDDSPPAARVEVRHGQRDDRLKFQGTDSLDSFRADDLMVYPMPDIDYQPIAPNVEYFPEADVRERPDLVAIRAALMPREWSNPVTGRQPLNTGYERLVGSFSRHIQVLREGGLDVVFVFDTTHSMQSFLLEVKRKIEGLALAFRKLVPTSRIGLVAYQDDDAESRFLTRIEPLTFGTVSLSGFLQQIDAWGGTDLEEAVDVALREAIENMPWAEKSKKFILLIGDAPPHAEDLPETLRLVEHFRRDMGGKIAVIDTRRRDQKWQARYETLMPEELRDFTTEQYRHSMDDEDVLDEFRAIAQAGGGEFARLDQDDRVIRDMLLLVFGSQWETYLGEFMRHL